MGVPPLPPGPFATKMSLVMGAQIITQMHALNWCNRNKNKTNYWPELLVIYQQGSSSHWSAYQGRPGVNVHCILIEPNLISSAVLYVVLRCPTVSYTTDINSSIFQLCSVILTISWYNCTWTTTDHCVHCVVACINTVVAAIYNCKALWNTVWKLYISTTLPYYWTKLGNNEEKRDKTSIL